MNSILKKAFLIDYRTHKGQNIVVKLTFEKVEDKKYNELIFDLQQRYDQILINNDMAVQQLFIQYISIPMVPWQCYIKYKSDYTQELMKILKQVQEIQQILCIINKNLYLFNFLSWLFYIQK